MKARTQFLYNIAKLLCFAEERNIALICYTFHRTPEQQSKEYEEGRSNCDGYVNRSKHQSWLAMDFVILNDEGNAIWDRIPEYTVLGEYWESIGGTWGGRWPSLGDIYHFEI